MSNYSHLRGYGWQIEALGRINYDLAIRTERDKKGHVLVYCWSLTKFGEPVLNGEGSSRPDCVKEAYKSIFERKTA